MRNKKWFFVLGTALVFGLLTGCGSGANTNGGSEENKTESPKKDSIAANFLTFIETKEENNSIIVNYKVKNISGNSRTLTFSSGLQADYIVYDQEGKKVKQYSDKAMSTQAIKEITLGNNQEIENGFTITDLINGQYKIEVFLTAAEEEAKVVTDLVVENSLYSMGVGILNGQIDPHTIEMKIEGEIEAFQLTDEAIQQLSSLKEGEKVSFIFTENEIQKTIERFVVDNN
jgi:Cu/Ag efflux protein CusF